MDNISVGLQKKLEKDNVKEHNDVMNTILEMGRLTKTEKLRAMEELWEDLSRSSEEYPSPEWHGDVLREREEAVREGTDEFIPWEDAKRILQERTK